MPIQSALALLGVAKQSAKGTAAANPTFSHGLLTGAVITVEVTQALEDQTSGNRVAPAVNRTLVKPGIGFSSRVHSASAGLWLYGALGSYSVSGAGPYTHVITSGADVPYLTGFGKQVAEIFAVQDLKVDSLAIKWSGHEALTMDVVAIGTAGNYETATFTPTTSDEFADYFRASVGTFSVDVDGAGSTGATAKIDGGSISIKNNLEVISVDGAIIPDDVWVGRQEVDCTFEIIPDDYALWKTIVTGTSTGTAESVLPIYGTFSIVFTNGADSLTLAAARVAFVCPFPDANPSGGHQKLSLAGMCVQPVGGGTPLTVTLINTTTTY